MIRKVEAVRNMFAKFSKKNGQSLFEVLFAIAIASIILTGVVSLSTNSVRNASFSNNNALASKYAQEAMEWLRQQRDDDWDDFFDVRTAGTGEWCLKTSPIPVDWPPAGACTDFIDQTKFIRNVKLSQVDLDSSPGNESVEATTTVSWADAQGFHEVRSTSRFTNWQAGS